MDHHYLLAAAINYMKFLQQRVAALEERAAANAVERSAAEEEGSGGAQMLPVIEARIRSNTVLIKIQCAKGKGLVKILDELDKLNLSVSNLTVAQFGNLAFDITIVTEMEKDFSLSTTDFVTAIRSALQTVS